MTFGETIVFKDVRIKLAFPVDLPCLLCRHKDLDYTEIKRGKKYVEVDQASELPDDLEHFSLGRKQWYHPNCFTLTLDHPEWPQSVLKAFARLELINPELLTKEI